MAETLTSQDRLYPINFVQVLSSDRFCSIKTNRKGVDGGQKTAILGGGQKQTTSKWQQRDDLPSSFTQTERRSING